MEKREKTIKERRKNGRLKRRQEQKNGKEKKVDENEARREGKR